MCCIVMTSSSLIVGTVANRQSVQKLRDFCQPNHIFHVQLANSFHTIFYTKVMPTNGQLQG